MGESRRSKMERSPCHECDLLHESKKNPRCEACRHVKEYDLSMGRNSEPVPLEMCYMTAKINKRWTSDEDEFLKDNFLAMKNKELAVELGRTERAVVQRLSTLKLRRYRLRCISFTPT